MKYINVNKLKAEIKKRLHCNSTCDECGDTAWDYDHGMVAAYNYVLSIIDSLQQEQPEVDLETFDKEVTKMWGRCAAEPNDTIACLHIDSFIEITRHFFELGRLNAGKEE